MNETNHLVYAPNLLNICVEEVSDRDCSGRIWHQYSRKAPEFRGTAELLRVMEELFDRWDFPQNSTVPRTFKSTGTQGAVRKRGETARELDARELNARELQEKRGGRATFLVHVKYRQNATWQGEVIWAEKQQKQSFRSALELLKLIDSALDEAERR